MDRFTSPQGLAKVGRCKNPRTRHEVEGKQKVKAGRAAELQLGLARRGESAATTAWAGRGQAGSAPAGAARDHDDLIKEEKGKEAGLIK